jgi:hypothetical protein
MQRKWLFIIGCCLATLLMCSAGSYAQGPRRGPGGAGPDLGPRSFGGWPGDGIGLLGFGGNFGNKVVTGQPYSAQVTYEHIQPVAGGNPIDRKTTNVIYRDSQGRTRRELTLPAIGPYAASGNPPQVVFINDPVAGVSYVLDPTKMTARKFSLPQRPGGNGPRTPGDAGPTGPRPDRKNDPNVTTSTLTSPPPPGCPTGTVQGTQITRTIPQGQIGNDQPIQIINRRWYCPALSIDLKTETIDPLHGNSNVLVTITSTNEPAISFFEVPQGYTIEDSPRGRGGRGPRPGRPPQ